MELIEHASIDDGALLLVDAAPIVYVLESNPRFAGRYVDLFERHAAGALSVAITTVTIAEVLAGPIAAGNEGLVKRYRTTLDSWQVVELTADIAEGAARIRVSARLKLPDAVQAASALAIGADALITHDRDFSRLAGLRVIL